jgi:hypothetical protein
MLFRSVRIWTHREEDTVKKKKMIHRRLSGDKQLYVDGIPVAGKKLVVDMAVGATASVRAGVPTQLIVEPK